ncbi:MAG: hypothetical protein ACRD2S_01660 [Terriglobales bacterium]
MFERLKRSLVDSFIGAIALGFLFAQGIMHAAYIFTAPVTNWIARKEYRGLASGLAISTNFSLQDAVPELARAISLLLLGYFLLRWLYFEPLEKETPETPSQRA